MRAYIRLDPHYFERKVIEDRYPVPAAMALIAVFCLGEAQQPRGNFGSERLLRLMLDEPRDGVKVGLGRWVRYLLDKGDLIRRPDGMLYIDGWDEWQEGDVTVKERMVGIRVKRGEPPPSPGAARTAQWRLRNQVFERDGYTCRYCLSSEYERAYLVAEHVIPDGPTTLENLVTACRPCNKIKGARTPEEAGMTLHPVPNGDASRDRHKETTGDESRPNPDRLSGRRKAVGGRRKAVGAAPPERTPGARDHLDHQREGLPHLPPEAQDAIVEAGGMFLAGVSDKVLTDLDGLVERNGLTSVADTMASVRADGARTWQQLIYRTRNRLEPLSEERVSPAERRRREADDLVRRLEVPR